MIQWTRLRVLQMLIIQLATFAPSNLRAADNCDLLAMNANRPEKTAWSSETVEEIAFCLREDANIPDPLMRSLTYESAQVFISLLESGYRVKVHHWEASIWEGRDYVEAIIRSGFDVNTRSSDGFTALCRAAARGDTSVIKLLLEHGADIHARSLTGETPVMCAAKLGESPAALEFLINSGGNLYDRDSLGRLLIHHAAINSYSPEFVTVLVKRGMDINALSYFDMTPLHWAVFLGRKVENIKLLISLGADGSAKDEGGLTPFDYIKDREDLKDQEVYWLLNDARFR